MEQKNNNKYLELKRIQFNAAMKLYDEKSIYKLIGKAVSFINVSLQIFLIYLILPLSIGPLLQIFAIAVSFLAADFINGLVHMYMDNNENYTAFTGPLIASFHLHHKTPLYKKSNLLMVYYNETGSKIWLIAFLALSAIFIEIIRINPVISYILVYTGILSSVAEVTHYRCHVPDSKISKYLWNPGIFLKKRHHSVHHIKDNVRYAFLSGITDPLLDLIAKKFYSGYKNTTDLHYELYEGEGTENRG